MPRVAVLTVSDSEEGVFDADSPDHLTVIEVFCEEAIASGS
jgi:hypothetical protein